ncbi:MAG TPA: hypothetical protein VGC29_00140 [Flavisolibacter sp.]
MIKYITILVLLFLLRFQAMAQPSFAKLVGKWESPEGMGLVVIDSSRIFLYYGKDTRQVNSFQFDFSKTPCSFDFVLKDSAGSLSLKSLFLLISDNMLQWQLFDDSRPDNFSSEKGEMVYLRRKQ